MIKRVNFYFLFAVFLLFPGCSLDKKTGIWDGYEKQKKKIDFLRKERQKLSNTITIYSTQDFASQEIPPKKAIVLSAPKKNSSWKMSGYNIQNDVGHKYLSSITNQFLKKKISKNKFTRSEEISPILISKNYIYLTNDSGTIFKVNFNGKLVWKKNIYKKSYKKLYKKLSLAIHKDNLLISDNMGFIYSIDQLTGDPIWIKNLVIPLKSQLKIFDNKMYVVNQDNRLLSLRTKDGVKVWDIRSISSYIKSQSLISISISDSGDLVFLNSSGDLSKVNANTGRLTWTLSAKDYSFAHDTDFFESSNIVINDNSIFFTTSSAIYSYDLYSGYLNWSQNVNSKGDPIIDGEHVFLVTKDGFFLNFDKNSGEIIWSTNILPILDDGWKIPFEKEKSKTVVTGYTFGSGKLYITTFNGFLIVCSASTGKTESFKRVAFNNTYSPIISNNSLFVLTKTFRLLGFN
jgi:outer membrane protein assembly factor BamB